jgi:hypothetical protein
MRGQWMGHFPWRTFPGDGFRQRVGQPDSLTLTGYLHVIFPVRRRIVNPLEAGGIVVSAKGGWQLELERHSGFFGQVQIWMSGFGKG